MKKLKKKIILELMIIWICVFMITSYILGFILPNIYHSNFILSTITVIFAGVILMFMFPLYYRHSKIFDEKYETEETINTNKPFWSCCIIVFGLISIISIISYFTLGALVFLLNLRPSMLNVITIIIIIILIISLSITFSIIIIRDVIKK